jgi:hypothetical protein
VSSPKIAGKSRKEAEDQPLVPGDFQRALNGLELPLIALNRLRFRCAKFAQLSRLHPPPQAVLREDV